MRSQFLAFSADDSAATAIEYAFLASLVAITAFGAMVSLGNTIDEMFGIISNGVDNSVDQAVNG